MNRAVPRLLDEREAQGLSRHVEDEAALAQVAQLLNANDDRAPARRTAARGTAAQPAVLERDTYRA